MALDSIRRSMEYSQATSPATAERPPAGEASTAGTLGPGDEAPAGTVEGSPGSPGAPGFGARGRMRRRARFLRKARELAYRDLGGLVYSLHRFGQRNDALVLAKLETITRIDNELRGLESALAEHQPVTVLREAGVAACPRCAAIHGSDDRFCPNCGLAMDPRAERPVAGAAAPAQAQPPSALAGTAPPIQPPTQPPTQPPIQLPIQPRATPAPAKASESSEGAADERGRGKAGTSVDESTEIIRPPIESS
ncbi:MAG TPA: zinc ribbon domain-containing protein [Solirubrobacteraceae bacterium]|nr:zinc ribbon domain-containing protein [Solirubrobacteraceae bacterium]